MTYGVMVDLIRAEQKLQCELRQLPYTKIGISLLFQLISQAEEEIQRRIQVIRNITPIDLTSFSIYADEVDINYVGESGLYYVSSTNTYIYDLPEDFGNLTELTLEGIPIEYVTPEMFASNLDNRSTLVYTLVVQSGKHLLKLGPTDSIDPENELIPTYFITVQPYRDRSIDTDTGLIFPNDYQDLIKLGVMKYMFADYEIKFERGIKSHKEYRNSQGLDQLPGEVLGGV